MGSNQGMASGSLVPTSQDVNAISKALGRAGFPIIPPELVPAIKAVTMATVAQMRTIAGDISGNIGPACCLLNATATPGDGGVGVFYWHNTSTDQDDNGVTTVQVMGSSGQFKTPGCWKRVSQVTPGRLLRRSWLTSGTTQTSAPGATLALAVMVGGGGGSGGAVAFGVSYSGGGGSYAEWLTSVIPATWNYTIGAGGAAGAATPTAGGNGGSTTLNNGTTTVTCPGGTGGAVANTGTGTTGAGGAGGATPNVPAGQGVNLVGEQADPSIYISATAAWSGRGGSSPLGYGGKPQFIADTAGNLGVGFGAGGAGARAQTASRAGAAGTQGIIILSEFS